MLNNTDQTGRIHISQQDFGSVLRCLMGSMDEIPNGSLFDFSVVTFASFDYLLPVFSCFAACSFVNTYLAILFRVVLIYYAFVSVSVVLSVW